MYCCADQNFNSTLLNVTNVLIVGSPEHKELWMTRIREVLCLLVVALEHFATVRHLCFFSYSLPELSQDTVYLLVFLSKEVSRTGISIDKRNRLQAV